MLAHGGEEQGPFNQSDRGSNLVSDSCQVCGLSCLRNLSETLFFYL